MKLPPPFNQTLPCPKAIICCASLYIATSFIASVTFRTALEIAFWISNLVNISLQFSGLDGRGVGRGVSWGNALGVGAGVVSSQPEASILKIGEL